MNTYKFIKNNDTKRRSRTAKEVVERKRARIADILGVDPKDVLTLNEASEYTGFSRVTILKYANMGILIRRGGPQTNRTSFYLRSDLKEMITNEPNRDKV